MPRDIAVHLFNRSEPFFAGLYAKNPRSPGGLPTAAVGTHDRASTKEVIDAVKSVVGSGDRVRVMRMVGHGNSGVFFFPGMWNYYTTSIDYAQLRGVFATGGRLEIHGCGVASETDIMKPGADPRDASFKNTVPGRFTGKSNGAGLVYLKRVAAIFNVPTTAAINVQVVSANDWSYEGDTVTVFPNGKFVMDSEGTRSWDLEAVARAADRFKSFILNTYAFKGKYQEAIRQLRELIAKYPRTPAAEWAREHLTVDDLKNDLMLPDD